ncbi:MAG: hypothetical protein F9K43_03665, partial [Bauldia sp.]
MLVPVAVAAPYSYAVPAAMAVEPGDIVEVPLGTPLKTLVYDVGEGAANGKHVKAIQTGGPSGGCIPQ